MASDRPEPGSPADWLRYARADLALAQVPLPAGGMLELLCFHAQQAVEKSLKAILVHHRVLFRPTHDIAALLTDLRQAGIAWPEELDEVVDLTRYAVATRYPGTFADVAEEDYHWAVEMAQRAVRWAETSIN